MILAFSDIESTGLLGPDNTPGDQRIIEVYAGLYDLASRKKVDELNLRINPQRSITPGAQAIHKISIEDLRFCPIWKDVAGEVLLALERADVVIGHNWDGFDAPFLAGEMTRVGLPKPSKPTFDTMLQGRWATPTGLVPSLAALCWACDVPYDPSKAHAADYDCDVLAQSFFRGLDWGFFKLEEAPAAAIAA